MAADAAPRTAPYGTWESVITPALLAGKSIALDTVGVDVCLS